MNRDYGAEDACRFVKRPRFRDAGKGILVRKAPETYGPRLPHCQVKICLQSLTNGFLLSLKVNKMNDAVISTHETLVKEWTDQFVRVNPDRPELKRFNGIVGRVMVN